MMTKEQIFSIWAPDESPWSRWVKPVLFAHIGPAFALEDEAQQLENLNLLPGASENFAIIADLPGAEGVTLGLSLAQRGFRPIPLYNALPIPSAPLLAIFGQQEICIVDVNPIIRAIDNATKKLSELSTLAAAPPAFLLDANRSGDGRKPIPEQFDNRSISFVTDFPSAIFLQSRGIQRVLLIQKDRFEPRPDLVHILRRWQEGGLNLQRFNLAEPAVPRAFEVPRPSWYRTMFQRALASIGFRRAWGGEFGNWIAGSSAAG